MAVVFDVMLMERRADEHVTTGDWRTYLADSFRKTSRSTCWSARLLGERRLRPDDSPGGEVLARSRSVAHDAIVRDVGRLFLGVDLQCAQCHDHPTVTDYHHAHYYGLHVFFAGTKLFRQPSGDKLMSLQEEVVREATFASVFDPDVQNKTGPRLMDGPMMEVPRVQSGRRVRREAVGEDAGRAEVQSARRHCRKRCRGPRPASFRETWPIGCGPT